MSLFSNLLRCARFGLLALALLPGSGAAQAQFYYHPAPGYHPAPRFYADPYQPRPFPPYYPRRFSPYGYRPHAPAVALGTVCITPYGACRTGYPIPFHSPCKCNVGGTNKRGSVRY